MWPVALCSFFQVRIHSCRNRYIFETWVSRQILSALGHFGNHFLPMVAALFLLDLYTSWRRSTVFSWFFPCDFHACVKYVRCFRYEVQHPSAILMVNGGRGQSHPAISSSTFRSPCKELSGEAFMVVKMLHKTTQKSWEICTVFATVFASFFLPIEICSWCWKYFKISNL